MNKISVIIPVYNRLEHLKIGISLLNNQKIKPYELIIADDGSSEDISSMLENLIEKVDFKIKWVFHKDNGFRKTRIINEAVKIAEGEILVFCDQDLIFPEDYLEKILLNIKNNNFLMGRASYLTLYEKERFVETFNKNNSYTEATNFFEENYKLEIKKLIRKDKIRKILKKLKLNKRGIKLVGMSFALYKDIFIKINGYDENYQGWGYEDDDLGNRLIALGIEGENLMTNKLMYHLWHSEASSKKESLNEEYYYNKRKEILNKNKYYCKNGYNNSLIEDKVLQKIIKN